MRTRTNDSDIPMMHEEMVTQLLRKTELFAQASDALLASLRGHMSLVTLDTGSVLFEQGDTGDALYLIAEGELEVIADGIPIATRTSGECIGEMALLDDSPRSAKVVASKDSLLLELNRHDFHRTLSQFGELTSALFRVLGQRLREDITHDITLIRQQVQFQQDLRRAREIQLAMLPSEPLSLEWLSVCGRSEPATVVGGDYYSHFALPDGRVAVVVGDVAGHGFYSSLLVATVSSVLQLQVRHDPSPVAVHQVLHQTVRNYRHTRMLMTLVYLVLDPVSHSLQMVNAGHHYPYLYRKCDDRWDALEFSTLPLGSLLDADVTVHTEEWQSGDRLFLYTDGVTEMEDAQGNLFGFSGLAQFLSGSQYLAADEMVKHLYASLDEHSGTDAPQDDVTAVAVNFL